MADIEDLAKKVRIAIVNPEKCKPKKCNLECMKGCPVNMQGKMCIEVEKKDKLAQIGEQLCIGCGRCEKVCPFDAIKIINLPSTHNKMPIHRYGKNQFVLYELPIPKFSQVLGLVGQNGLGKSTILKILGQKMLPNLGETLVMPTEEEIMSQFKGSELQKFFSEDRESIIKVQDVLKLPKIVGKKRTVYDFLKYPKSDVLELFSLDKLKNREIGVLSGGELQRLVCCFVFLAEKEVTMFDEPTSFLDIKQRLKMSQLIQEMSHDRYVVVVEHDLAILDYLSDYICLLYGEPACYGVCSKPMSVRNGLNVFLEGYLPTGNVRFRDEPFKFRNVQMDEEVLETGIFEYSDAGIEQGDFHLQIEGGSYSSSAITVLLGENGIGKTTFIRNLAKNGMTVSMKEQEISLPNKKVYELLTHVLGNGEFIKSIIEPFGIDKLYDHKVKKLSGGELQKVAICLCLSIEADIYLLDEPSAYLDSESRMLVSKILRRFFMSKKKPAFIVEHDLLMSTFLADQIVLFEGTPGSEGHALCPMSLEEGMNRFLESVSITLRKDQVSGRPRINKLNSQKDRAQKESGEYFVM